MGAVAEAHEQDLDELTGRAVESLNGASEDLVSWVDLVRDPEKPWALGWSRESVRGANVAATNYILQTAAFCGVLDRVLTPEQKQQGAGEALLGSQRLLFHRADGQHRPSRS